LGYFQFFIVIVVNSVVVVFGRKIIMHGGYGSFDVMDFVNFSGLIKLGSSRILVRIPAKFMWRYFLMRMI
jgi:hypothetical protein